MIYLSPRLYICRSFSSRMVNKIVEFCYEKVYVRLYLELMGHFIFLLLDL